MTSKQVGHLKTHSAGIVTLDRDGPLVIQTDNGRLERFMDRIYVPGRTEELNRDQVVIVNRLRLELIEEGAIEPSNEEVKRKVGALAEEIGARSVLEWGCGFHPVFPYLGKGVKSYVATDIDATAVEAQRQGGVEALLCDEAGGLDRHFDLAVSVFVWHFDIPVDHLRTLRLLLGSDGVLFANVYRRTEESRVRLARAVAEAGLDLSRIDDPRRICRAHEYWVMTPAGAPRREDVEQALIE